MICSVLIEIRPSLGIATVSILLKDSYKTKIKIRKNMMLLNIEEKEFTIPYNDFEVEPLTLTCLSARGRRIIFRISVINCKRFRKIPVKKIAPVNPNEMTKLLCKCGSPITEDIKFKRVLPLPSQEVDIADMFCHFDENSKISLSPKMSDCLYGIHYVTLNKDLLRNVKMTTLIKCNRCLSCIGTCDKELIKLWNISITFPKISFTAVEEFKRIIRSRVQESFVIFLKLFLECRENKSGLLISVMDKDLILSHGDESLELKTSRVLKLKYEYYKACNENLKRYLEIENVQCLEVPGEVLNGGFNFLLAISEEIPPSFRIIEGELMAYLEY